jgi:hypothetical protein
MTKHKRIEISKKAMHSNEMEGVPVTEEVRKFADNYEAGVATAPKLIEIAKSRYGIG